MSVCERCDETTSFVCLIARERENSTSSGFTTNSFFFLQPNRHNDTVFNHLSTHSYIDAPSYTRRRVEKQKIFAAIIEKESS